MPEQNVNQGHLFYETRGWEHSGPTLVFLGGLTQTTQSWSSHTRKLSTRYRTLAVDVRGQGRSSLPDSLLSPEDHGQDLAGLFDVLGVARAHVVGMSHGARVALGFAAQYPDRVNHLVLVSATAQPDAQARVLTRTWREVLHLGGVEALAWASLPTILGPQYLAENEKLLSGIVKATLQRNSVDGVKLLLDAMLESPELDALAERVRSPTMVLHGALDPLVTESGAQALADAARGVYRCVQGCGHTIPIERPDEFRAHVEEFLQ